MNSDNNDINMNEQKEFSVCIYPAQMICDEGTQMNSCQQSWAKGMYVGIISYSKLHDLFALVCGTTNPIYGISKTKILSNKTTFKQYEIEEKKMLEGILQLKLNKNNIAPDLGCKYEDIMKISKARLNIFCGQINDNNTNSNIWNFDNSFINSNHDFYKKMLRINTERKLQLKKELQVLYLFFLILKYTHVHVTFLFFFSKKTVFNRN